MRRIVQALAKMPSLPIHKAARLGDKLGMTGPGFLGSLGLDSQIPGGLWGESQVLRSVFPSESAQRAIAKVASCTRMDKEAAQQPLGAQLGPHFSSAGLSM